MGNKLEPHQIEHIQLRLAGESSGTSFPSSPTPGQMFYKTNDSAPYWYDSVRDKWVGELESIEAGYNGTMGAAGYLNGVDGVTGSKDSGFYIPFSIVIVGLSANWDSPSTGSITVRRNSAVVSTVSFSNVEYVYSYDLDDVFSNRGIMSFHSSVALKDVQVRCLWRRYYSG